LLAALLIPLVTGCSDDRTGPPPAGVVVGMVTSSLGGPLAGVKVTVTPTGGQALPAVSIDQDGRFRVSAVPVSDGNGTVTLSLLPSTCTAPAPASYANLTSGGTDTVNVVVTCTAPSGSLTVTVTGLTGPDASVQVSGPNDFTQTLTATTTLTGLALGSYTITATNVAVTDPIIGVIDTAVVSGSPATVSDGGTSSVGVSYVARGGLWVANIGNNTLVQLAAAQLQSGGSPSAAQSVGTGSLTSPMGLAVDSAGNIWVADYAANKVVEYSPQQLAAGGTPTPTVTLTGIALNAPHGLAFDAQGNLWVANRAANTVVEYTVSQLQTGGSLIPAVTLTAAAPSTGPTVLAFDTDGNLWVGNFYKSTLTEFTSSQLTSSGTPTPAVTLSAASNHSIQGPFALAFDHDNTLWVANGAGGADTVVAFTSAQRSASGSPVPAVTIQLPGSANTANPALPAGLAFDNSGNLWVSDMLKSALYVYTPSQLQTGGALTPHATIGATGAVNGPGQIIFDPHPTGLALH
jgi:sugar lactone lactonase YvrE